MSIPHVPNIKNATWHYPYRFSGRIPFGSLLLMLGIGFVTALIAGVIGYYGGAASRWLQVQITHLSSSVAVWLANWGAIGSGVAYVLVILPTILIGFVYPIIIGSIAGSGVMTGANLGKCRAPWLASLLGFLSGGVAYVAYVGTTLLMKAPLHESSRVLEMLDPPVSYGLMVIDFFIVLYAATKIARTGYETPFCELSGEWYGSPKTLSIPIHGAAPLVEALSGRSILPLQGVPVGITGSSRIQLNLSRCTCGKSDYYLIVHLYWDEVKKDKTTESKSTVWFNTTLPVSLGEEIERWSTSVAIPATQQQDQIAASPIPNQEERGKVDQPKMKPQAAPVKSNVSSQNAPKSALPSDPVTTKPGTTLEICKRCGGMIDTTTRTNFTCPYCGKTQWGFVINLWISSLIFLGPAIFWGPHISSSFWRAVVIWGGGILGGLLFVTAMAWFIKGVRTPLKPLSEVTFTTDTSFVTEIAAEPVTTQNAEMPEPTESEAAEVVSSPVQEGPVKKPIEIDWLVISNTCRKENYEELARLLYILDKRSDQEYSSDQVAYNETCKLIKEVGRSLDRKGGEDLMRQVLVQAGALGSNTRFIEREWNGIGTWWG